MCISYSIYYLFGWSIWTDYNFIVFLLIGKSSHNILQNSHYLFDAFVIDKLHGVKISLKTCRIVFERHIEVPVKGIYDIVKSGILKNEMGDKKGACADFNKAASFGSTEAADYAAQCK